MRGWRAVPIVAALLYIGSVQAGWTLRDSIETTYVATGAASADWDAPAEGQVLPSPDGSAYLVVLRRGDLDCDCNRYRLLVYDSHALRMATLDADAPVSAPRVLERTSSGNLPAIAQPRWVEDGRAVVFLGLDTQGMPQVFRFVPADARLTQLTSAIGGVTSFDYAAGSLLYLSHLDVEVAKGAGPLSRYPAGLVAGAMLPVLSDAQSLGRWGLFASLHGGAPRQLGAPRTGINPFVERYWLSPDGTRAIAFQSVPAADVPPGWSVYGRAGQDSPDASARVYYRFTAIDLANGSIRPALPSPAGQAVMQWSPRPEAVWSPRGDRVLLVNTTAPLGKAGNALSSDATLAWIVDYAPADGHWRKVARLPGLDGQLEGRRRTPDRVEWGADGVSVLLHYRRRDRLVASTDVYRNEGTAWVPATPVPALTEPTTDALALTATIDEGMNRPPRLAVAYRGHRREFAFDTGGVTAVPALTEEIRWRGPDGREWTGGFTRPAHGNARPWPLVIQIYDFDPSRFRPDGWYPTAFAAQPLAAHGFAVLQMRIRDVEGLGTAREGPSFVEGIDAAIAQLTAQGLVDRDRVGLVGFSRGAYLTYYTASHPGRTPLRAVVAADGWTASYVEYLLNAVVSEHTAATLSEFEAKYGGHSPWRDLQAWRTGAPGFNLQNIMAPVLISVAGAGEGPNHLLWALEPYAGLRTLGKPVDLLYLPEGQHQLKRPRERLASLGATVDWMRFWILGEEDPDAGKQAQYAHWRELRDRLVR